MLRAILLMAAMSCASVAAAQPPAATVSGRALDGDATPIAAARVVFAGEAAHVEVDTGPDGRFHVEMPPGTYRVRVSLSTYVTSELTRLVVDVGERVYLDVPLPAARIDATPGRIAVLRLPDTSATAMPDETLLARLPLDRDDAFSGLLDLAPGVSRGSAFGTAAEIGTPRRLDGLDLTDPLDGRTWTSFVLPSATSATVRVGVGAEERDGSGAVLDVVTRAGGAARGLIDVLGTGRAWTRDAVADDTLAVNPRLATRDRLGRSLRLAGVFSGSMTPRLGYGLAIEYADDARAGGSGARTRTPRGHGRLVWTRDAQSITMVGFLDHSATTRDVPVSAFGVAAPGLENRRTRSTGAGRGAWQAPIRSALTASVSVDVLHGTRETMPTGSGPGREDAVLGTISGSLGRISSGDRTRLVAAGSLGWLTHAAGGHDVRAGGEFERTVVGERSRFAGGEFFHDLAGRPDTVDVWSGSDRTAHLGRGAVFATDTWAPASRLSITAGVRAARLSANGSGSGAAYGATAIQPRVGAALSIDRAGRVVGRAHYGVVADPLYVSQVAPTLGGDSPIVTLQILPDGRRVEIGRTMPILARVADGIRPPQVRELSGGGDLRVARPLHVGATAVIRHYENAIDAVYTGARWIPQPRVGVDGRAVTSYRWIGRIPTDVPTIMNVDGLRYVTSAGGPLGPVLAERRYGGIVVHARADLPGGRGSLTAAYARATSVGTLDDTHDSGAGPNDAFASPTASLNNASGRSTLTPAYELTLFGTANVPLAPVRISGLYVRQAGTRYAAVRTFGAATLDVPFGVDGRTLRLEPRGSRTLDAVQELTLRVDTDVRVAHGRRLDVYADIQNVLASSIVTAVETSYPFGTTGTPGAPVAFETPIALQRPLRVLLGARYRF
jgi:hypothetical protein